MDRNAQEGGRFFDKLKLPTSTSLYTMNSRPVAQAHGQSLARLVSGEFATLLHLFKCSKPHAAERRAAPPQYLDACRAFATLHTSELAAERDSTEPPPAKRRRVVHPTAPTPSDGQLVLPAAPNIIAQVIIHEYTDLPANPFRISYPDGNTCWIDARDIVSQAALLLDSTMERPEAIACPPHDLYVSSSVNACASV